MILNVPDRLVLLSIIPKEGGYTTLKILRELRMNLGFTEEELKEWGIEQEDTLVNWEVPGETEIPIGETASGIIVDRLRELDNNNKLEEHMMDVYEKFIPTTE